MVARALEEFPRHVDSDSICSLLGHDSQPNCWDLKKKSSFSEAELVLFRVNIEIPKVKGTSLKGCKYSLLSYYDK